MDKPRRKDLMSELLILFSVFAEEHAEHQKRIIEMAKQDSEARVKTAKALREIANALVKLG